MPKLGEICKIESGGTPSRAKLAYWDGGNIPWIKISNMNSKFVENCDEFITQEGLTNSSAKIFPKGTILISIFATLGEVSILKFPATTNQAIAGLQILDNTVGTEYLYYFLKSIKTKIENIGRGVAQNNINLSILRNLDVFVPSKDEQDKIVSVMNQVHSYMSKLQKQLDDYDLLIKSRFIEMFGDLVHNSNGLEENCLYELADIVSGITKGRKTKETEFVEVPYMAVSNVKDGYIDWTTVKTIFATKSEIEQYRLQPNDILMTEGGDPDKLGRGSIIKTPLENCIHQNHIFRVRLNQKVVSPVYFSYFLKNPKAKRYFLNCAKQTTGIASINMTQLKSLPVIVPPLSLQNQFADFVAQVDKSKLAVQQSLNELETLKKSLMQQYFG